MATLVPSGDTAQQDAILARQQAAGGLDGSTPTTIDLSSPNLMSMPQVDNNTTIQYDTESEPGPSTLSRFIPPPPNPRRHRSGGLKSRMRADSGGPSLPTALAMTPSKSWSDLIATGLSMSTSHPRQDNAASGDEHQSSPDSYRRVLSEGYQAHPDDVEEAGSWDGDSGTWDNSARFYHRIHSGSRLPSRATSPTRSTLSASPHGTTPSPASGSPIFIRRNLTLPSPNMATSSLSAPGASLSASLSPNSHFLQQHLPPTFPAHSGSMHSTPETDIDNPLGPHHSMVILTPTTQEWRELQEIGRLEGEDLPDTEDLPSTDGSESDNMSDDVSVTTGRHPYQSSPDLDINKPTNESNSNVAVVTPSVPPPTSESNGMTSGQIHLSIDDHLETCGGRDIAREVIRPEIILQDMDQNREGTMVTPLLDEDGNPVRFSSIGRRESLRVQSKSDATAPRTKTKRELERERLFKLVDEEIAENPHLEANKRDSWGIQEIGSGGGLDLRPTVSISSSEGRVHSESPSSLAVSLPAVRLVPSIPSNPSPLQAAPLTAPLAGMATPSSLTPEQTPPNEDQTEQSSPNLTESDRYEAIRNYARSLSTRHTLNQPRSSASASSNTPEQFDSTTNTTYEVTSPPRSPRRRDTNRVSLVAGRVIQPFAYPALSPLASLTAPTPLAAKNNNNLQSFSPFRSPSAVPSKSMAPIHPAFQRFDSALSSFSAAPSTGAPSECGTPTSETAGGVGGRGIDDYVILKEAGKGAYGLVMRAKVKDAKGDPVGCQDEVIIKYIIKARILADCWKKHKILGPIPVEIHVMDQLRHLIYHPPLHPHPWDPSRRRLELDMLTSSLQPEQKIETEPASLPLPVDSAPDTPGSLRSEASGLGIFNPTQRYLDAEMRHAPERGHPNICKLLDFFEDKEFYYLVMPRYGAGVDLFDRVESQPAGLDPFEIRSLIGQLTDAVHFLHTNGIIHRDIKDENVILDGMGRCQLIDFGSAAHWRPGKRWDTFSGTLHYASPEILRGEMYGGKEQDIWALGTVAYVLLVGETPFVDLPDEVLVGLTPDSRAEAALGTRYHNDDEGSEQDGGGSLADAADLIRRCLEMDVANRPTAEDLLNHRYLIGKDGWIGHRGWVKGK